MRCALLLFLLALSACTTPSTQIVVLVDSDLSVPAELSTVRVVTSRGEVVVSQVEFAIANEEAPAVQTLPFSFGVIPTGGDASERVRIVVQALDAFGAVVVERAAVVGFIAGRTQLLPMFLARSCRAVMCPMDQTCTRNGCVPIEILPGEIPIIIPGTELMTDAPDPFPDAARDAEPVDAGGLDASTDVFVSDVPRLSDAPPTSCVECGALGFGCGSDCPDDGTCRCGGACACDIRCGEGEDCATNCSGGSVCRLDVRRASNADVTCSGDAVCVVDAREASNVDAACRGTARCDIDCTDVSNCFVTCTEGAECLINCRSASNCEFTSCTGSEMSCPDGIVVCNRACP
jgi:hypothetical protein